MIITKKGISYGGTDFFGKPVIIKSKFARNMFNGYLFLIYGDVSLGQQS